MNPADRNPIAQFGQARDFAVALPEGRHPHMEIGSARAFHEDSVMPAGTGFGGGRLGARVNVGS